jgi:2-polyprenyl-6-methoxyphenol hydroxylase-like FAD-dependent oxidoreductase
MTDGHEVSIVVRELPHGVCARLPSFLTRRRNALIRSSRSRSDSTVKLPLPQLHSRNTGIGIKNFGKEQSRRSGAPETRQDGLRPDRIITFLNHIMKKTIETDVLIIGAGPTGLSLACQLLRYGINFVVIEKNAGLTPYSKAIGVHARTLEIFDQIGLAQEAIARGTIAGSARLLIDGEIRGELDFSDIGKGLSPFPFVLMLEQSKTESLLYEYLRSHQSDVLWKTELLSFLQDADGIVAQVKTPDEETQAISAKYIVGCDGPKSLVRHQLGLSFGGSTFERIFYVADAQVDWQMGHDTLHVCFSPDSFVVFFPLKGEKRYRIVGVFPEEFNRDEGDILYEEIEARIKTESKLDLDIFDVEWFSTYKVHTRHANKFSAGRGFLVGDSAHVHTPAGAQGMNTGIQDGYNLAWKIALAIHDRAGGKLLETYNEERLENAKRLLKTTDRFFGFAAGTDWLMNFFRLHVLPPLAKHMFTLDAVRKFAFPLVSQTGINYRHGSLSNHAGDEDFEVKAGDRLPYFLTDGNSIYGRLQQAKFHFLAFSSEPNSFIALKNELEGRYPALVDVNGCSISPEVQEVFGTNTDFSVFLRPDNHVGFISSGISSTNVQDYLTRFIGHSDGRGSPRG